MSRALIFLLLLAVANVSQAERDPTQPSPGHRETAASVDQAPVELTLHAILRRDAYVRAVINGQTLAVGEKLADIELLAIHRRSVTIEREGRQELLHLAQPIVKPSR